MTKKEAIGWLKYAVPIRAVTSDEFSDFIVAVNMAIDALRPQWIPCSERLPEINGHHESDTVLCYTDTGIYTFSVLQENIFGQCGFECERDDDYHVLAGKVIAWMPLPEPWKEEE